MAYLKEVLNYNGTSIVTREVVARFKYGRIIMAHMQLTLVINVRPKSTFNCLNPHETRHAWHHEPYLVAGQYISYSCIFLEP